MYEVNHSDGIYPLYSSGYLFSKFKCISFLFCESSVRCWVLNMRHGHLQSDSCADIEASDVELRCHVTAVNSGLQMLYKL